MTTVARNADLRFGLARLQPFIDGKAFKCYAHIEMLRKDGVGYQFLTGTSITQSDGRVIHLAQGDQFGNKTIVYTLVPQELYLYLN